VLASLGGGAARASREDTPTRGLIAGVRRRGRAKGRSSEADPSHDMPGGIDTPTQAPSRRAIDADRDRLADEHLTLGQIEGDGRRSREFWNLIAAQSPGYCLRTRRSSSAVRGRCNRRCESCSASSINASRRATGISRRPSGQRSRRWGCCLGSVTVAHVSRATSAPSIGQLPYRLSPTSGSVDRVEEAVPADVLSPLPQERRTDTMTSWCPRRVSSGSRT
jgi:hypothetical protein